MKRLVIIDTTKHTRKTVPDDSQEIGRGKFLECDDKRISRSHGRIAKELKGSQVLLRLESLHINAIFCQKKDCTTDYLLKKDESILLEVGDKFRLLQDGDWFEVGEDTTEINFQNTGMSVEMESQHSTTQDSTQFKRKHDSENPEDASKKQRILDQENCEEPSTSSQSVPATDPENIVCPQTNTPDAEAVPAAAVDVKPDPDNSHTSSAISQVQIKPDPDAAACNTGSVMNDPGTSGSSTASSAPPVNIKPDPDGTGGKAGLGIIISGAVNPTALRPSCDYGIRCYRAGQEHRSAYAHPGDLDYRRPNLPPPPPGSPMCPFGARCYRRNPQHFREYNHPDPNADLLRPPRRRYGALRVEDLYNPSDEYDSEDDFEISENEYYPGMFDDSDDYGSDNYDDDGSEGDNNADSGLDC